MFVKNLRTLALISVLGFGFKCSMAQNQIALEFNQVELREEFTDRNEYWPYLTTMENLYVPDKDEYFMHRQHKTNPYAIITDWKNNLSTFNILTTLKLGPTETTDQSIGVIFLVQPDGKGAVVFEFNKFKQYRIKQLVGAYYKFLSGDNESQGWVKSSLLSGKEEYNVFDIRVNLPQIDIYLNDKFVQSFDLPEMKPGNMGFLIGPDTKAKADYFYVYTTPTAKEEAVASEKEQGEAKSAVEQLAKMRYELEQKDREVKECQLERQTAVTRLEEQIGALNEANDRLTTNNNALREFKNQVLMDIDEDVFLTLAENLKAEIIKNQRLESQVQIYKDSLKLTHVQYNKLKLALLDKAIVKAEKDKVVRDQKEAAQTKEMIESELQDKKLGAEQEKWEKSNQNVKAKLDTAFISKLAEEPAKVDKEVNGYPNNSSEVSKDEMDARPLPTNVRKAQKKQD